MAKASDAPNTSVNLIGGGTIIKGDIISAGDVRIDGTLEGSLNAKGKLVVGPTGSVDGELFCQNADISGQLNGQITVSELLSLKSTSKVTGDIVTNKLSIEPGAVFTGSCSMGAVIKDMKHGDKEQQGGQAGQRVPEKTA